MTKRTAISVSTVFAMITVDDLGRYRTLDEYLTRPLTRVQAAALSPEVRKHRRLAQIRICHGKVKLRRELARVARAAADRAPGRDILDLTRVLINA